MIILYMTYKGSNNCNKNVLAKCLCLFKPVFWCRDRKKLKKIYVWNLKRDLDLLFLFFSGMQSGRPDILPKTPPQLDESGEYMETNLSNSSLGSTGLTSSSPPLRYYLQHSLFILISLMDDMWWHFCSFLIFCVFGVLVKCRTLVFVGQ